MPQHQRTGFRWTVQRLAHGARLALDVRRRPPSPRPPTPVPADPQVTQRPLTTLDATLRPSAAGGPDQRYRVLVWSGGEPHVVREDLGARADPGRQNRRRSLLYFAHHTDAHLTDAQSPARMEAGERLAWLNPGTDAGHRPQELCTVPVFDQMIRATNAVATSPLSGASMAFCVQTGDNTDNRQHGEVRWFVDCLDGVPVTPDTGAPGRYEGVQCEAGLSWAYHPEDPSSDPYGRYGFPRLPGLLDSAIRPVQTAGVAVPWLAVMGNHDSIWEGTFGPAGRLRLDRMGRVAGAGCRKPTTLRSYGWLAVMASIGSGSWSDRWASRPGGRGSRGVTADPAARRPLDLRQYLAELFATSPTPGPVGHGFTPENLRRGTAYWSRPEGNRFQLVGLDTNNHTTGSEGRMGPVQRRWLESELVRHQAAGRLVVVCSHHNSWTMTNGADDESDPGEACSGPDLVELLARFPNVVAWVNGHSHENRVLAHRGAGGGGQGLWELNTVSCIDFGQQSRVVEVFDNRDGTLSIVATVVDHAAPPSITPPAGGRYSPAQLASISRELASNDARWIDPFTQLGYPEDRNVELLVADPAAEQEGHGVPEVLRGVQLHGAGAVPRP